MRGGGKGGGGAADMPNLPNLGDLDTEKARRKALCSMGDGTLLGFWFKFMECSTLSGSSTASTG